MLKLQMNRNITTQIKTSLILVAVGLLLLAFSCTPMKPLTSLHSVVTDEEEINDSTAPGTVSDIRIASIESTSFVVQWTEPPETTGTKLDGTALSPDEIVYFVYYLARRRRTSGQTEAITEEAITEESIEQNPDTQSQVVTGVSRVKIIGLEPSTLYAVAVVSYNPFAQLGAVSSEVVEASTAVAAADFYGNLVYEQAEYSFTLGLGSTITPTSTPVIPITDTSGVVMRYDLAKRDGADVGFEPSIDESDGVITINPSDRVGRASYVVQASAEGYNIQYVIVSISINANAGVLQVQTYYDVITNELPVELGQAIVDSGAFALADDTIMITIAGLIDGEHTIHFGSEIYTYSESRKKEASNGSIRLSKSEFKSTNSFSFVDGAVVGISGLGITGIQHVATYHPSNIYNHQDLQGMRIDLARAYILKNDIEFAPMTTGDTGTIASNYEAVGDDRDPFTGSLDGSGYSITGIQIKSLESYQGLFGVMEADTINRVMAQNLVLRDFKITGNAVVGSLAGQIKRGIVNDVSVELRNADAGGIEVSGHIDMPGSGRGGFGGGLLGRAGMDAAVILVKIQNTNSVVTVSGLETNSNYIGGLVGSVGRGALLIESYATGSVTGAGGIGGLAGYNGGTVSGYTTGVVRGNDRTGGLVGHNVGGTVTGYVTESVTGNDYVGGLVGDNSGTVTGYATGSVTGVSGVGGLVGTSSGIVSGYTIGLVRGSNDVGGLLGNNNGGTVSGYATGLVRGIARAGGLIGINSGIVSGYARGIVRRAGGTEITFGKTIGASTETFSSHSSSRISSQSLTYSSAIESLVYDGVEGTNVLTDISGVDDTEFAISSTTVMSSFHGLVLDPVQKEWVNGFTFGKAQGEWTWVEGKWPAINIGETIKPVDEQPIDVCLFASSIDQCRTTTGVEMIAYHGLKTFLFPIELGQAIADHGVFALPGNSILFTIRGLVDGDYTLHFGSVVDNYNRNSYRKTAENGIIRLLKSELNASSFSFVNGAVIGISGPSFTGIQHVVTYQQSNIYNRYDLQAMRRGLNRNYVLKKNIVFLGTGASNYEVIGNDNNPFTGSFDGKGFRIVGIEIENTENYLGLFGAIEARTVDTKIVQDLVLRDFNITGNAYVGSLTGWLKRGTVDNVRVEVSNDDAGMIKAKGSIHSSSSSTRYGYGGGLLGRAGTGTSGSIRVRIENTSSEIKVIGLEKDVRMFGGLVGMLERDGQVTGSYATGFVTSAGYATGGLVGWNASTVIGYATGNAIGHDVAGGLVGYNSGTVIGYATGNVRTSRGSGGHKTTWGGNFGSTGGLVGYNTGTVTGYATGSVAGYVRAGGLVGHNDEFGIVTGYARSIVRRNAEIALIFKDVAAWFRKYIEDKIAFGQTIGKYSETGTTTTYSSASESHLYDGIGGVMGLGGLTGSYLRECSISLFVCWTSSSIKNIVLTGDHGTEVTLGGSTARETFYGLTFGTEIGEWTWVADGRWPAINIGNETKPAREQPVKRKDGS